LFLTGIINSVAVFIAEAHGARTLRNTHSGLARRGRQILTVAVREAAGLGSLQKHDVAGRPGQAFVLDPPIGNYEVLALNIDRQPLRIVLADLVGVRHRDGFGAGRKIALEGYVTLDVCAFRRHAG
jgi:hypothetical protein